VASPKAADFSQPFLGIPSRRDRALERMGDWGVGHGSLGRIAKRSTRPPAGLPSDRRTFLLDRVSRFRPMALVIHEAPIMRRRVFFAAMIAIALPLSVVAADAPLAEYFRVETAKLSARPIGGIETGDAWKVARPELQRQLREMLGLDPLPEKTDLHARITGV